jgi:hypothetical protein
VSPCVCHYSSLCKMNRKYSNRSVGLRKIPVNRIFCIITSSTQGDKVRSSSRKFRMDTDRVLIGRLECRVNVVDDGLYSRVDYVC